MGDPHPLLRFPVLLPQMLLFLDSQLSLSDKLCILLFYVYFLTSFPNRI